MKTFGLRSLLVASLFTAMKVINGALLKRGIRTLVSSKCNRFSAASSCNIRQTRLYSTDGESQQQKQKQKQKQNQKQQNQKQKKKADDKEMITPRDIDYSAWYNDVIDASDMVDKSPVRGCMVIKPWGMSIWELMKSEFDYQIRELDVEPAYFPLFIPQSFLSKEADHVDGFAKECAVVTHHRLCTAPDGDGLIPDPDAKLEEPLIVRPTSETVIWSMFSKWIQSHRDLPLKINQWANVVRWELRTRPFLRSAEFLWQEGHTAHSSHEEADQCARTSLDMYSDVCASHLAVPVVKGIKSPSERFAGADETYTIEALMQNGWALQSGTSHYLGQNFARAFDVFYQTEEGGRELVWATSWGVSTRLLGALIMTHSDDKGLVLPPRLAPQQVVIVPIKAESSDAVKEKVEVIRAALKKGGVRVKVDDRTHVRPGAKFFEWERKGVPIRLEIGPRDLENNIAMKSTRWNGEKAEVSISNIDVLVVELKQSLETVHSDLLNNARERLTARTFFPETYADMVEMLQNSDSGDESEEGGGSVSKGLSSTVGFYQVPWKCDADNEEFIKQDCKASIRCYPLDLNEGPGSESIKDKKCFYSGEPATHWAIFARAF